MTSPKAAKPLDLDAQLELSESPETTRSVTILGEEIRVVCDLNAFALSQAISGDEESLIQNTMTFLQTLVHPEDWSRFSRRLSTSTALRGEHGYENLIKILNALTEVAAERPTKRPSDLQRGASTRATGRPSRAASSKGKVSAVSR